MDRRQREIIIKTLQEKGVNTDNIVELNVIMDYEQTNYPKGCLVLFEGEGESAYGKLVEEYLTKRKIRYVIGSVYGELDIDTMVWYFKINFKYYDGNEIKYSFSSKPVCALKHEHIHQFPWRWKLMINGDEYKIDYDENYYRTFRGF